MFLVNISFSFHVAQGRALIGDGELVMEGARTFFVKKIASMNNNRICTICIVRTMVHIVSLQYLL